MTDIGARLRQLPADALAALAFFSRLPVPAPAGAFDLRQTSAAWPLAGLLLAVAPSLVLLAGMALDLSPIVVALLAIAAAAAVTGALHEDGLADTADGFGGGGSRDAKLAIMRDSRLGAYGGLALIFLVGLKAGSLLSLLADPASAVIVLIGAAVLSRSLALWHWHSTLPARREGLAWAAGRPDWLAFAIASLTGLAAGLILILFFGMSALLAILLALVGTALFSDLCRRQVGGHTGDTVGAAQQIAETLLLVGFSRHWAPIIV